MRNTGKRLSRWSIQQNTVQKLFILPYYMIKPTEIKQFARQSGVRDIQIEKHYILTWILYSISKHEQLSKALAFKGGTVKK